MNRLAFSLVALALQASALFGQSITPDAPGAPGQDAHWPSAAKNGFATANSVASKIWLTLNNGVMTEVFYPRLDVPNSQCLQFVVCGSRGCETESEDSGHIIKVLSSRALSFQQINVFSGRSQKITKTYTVDPQRATILIHVSFASDEPDSRLYVYYDPSLNNSGMHDTGWTSREALLASDGPIASALIASTKFDQTTNGYLGTNDGLRQLRTFGRITQEYLRAGPGNIVQVGRIPDPTNFTLALGFGSTTEEALGNARASLSKGFSGTRQEYEAGWFNYIRRLRQVDPRYEAQIRMAALVLKALEDKTYRGAMIASPSTPWGGGPNANESTISGYHAVWARDLYQVATALLALGDRNTANRALDYLFKVQQKSDGSFPQNSWVDGRPIGVGLQMDQIALPLVLAYQLNRNDRNSWLKHIKPAADLIVKKGPRTEQERWEEEAGYSPSTIAAEIAGLVCAARAAYINGDRDAAERYLAHADEWSRKIDEWTASTSGPLEAKSYYLRISENQDPNDGARIEINSGGGSYDEREIVDAGFLELVRLGIKSPRNELIVRSLAVVDRVLLKRMATGAAWYRYNHDAYGETEEGADYNGTSGRGRLWTLLTGERGEYELARGNTVAAQSYLDALMAFANEGLMIPEQVWDHEKVAGLQFRKGKETGSATPLAWSMAQFIRLALSLHVGYNIETPAIVQARYATKRASSP